MLAVGKSDALEFVRYFGLFMESYPEWFMELVEVGLIYEDYGYGYYGYLPMYNGDVVLYNPRTKESFFMDSRAFNDKFYEVQ